MAGSRMSDQGISEHVLTNLLASAYALQERQDHLKTIIPNARAGDLMFSVLDTQRLICGHAIHPENAMELVASRSQKLSGAGGVAIALLNGECLEYKIAIGIATPLGGAKILADASSSFQQLRCNGTVESNSWRDKALGTRITANCVVSAPVHRHGELAGCIQLFSRVGQLGDEAIYVSELMSAFLTQLIEENTPEAPLPNSNYSSMQGSVLKQQGRQRREDQADGLRNTSEAVVRDRAPVPPAPAPSSACSGEPSVLPEQNLSLTAHRFNAEADKLDNARLDSGRKDWHENGKESDTAHSLSTTFESSERPRSFASAIAYPIGVGLFAVLANLFNRTIHWQLTAATAVIFTLTVIELRRIWHLRRKPQPGSAQKIPR
jgi:hypothetical protein